LVEFKDFLIALGLCHFHGLMEYWNNGVMDFKGNKSLFFLFPNIFTQPAP